MCNPNKDHKLSKLIFVLCFLFGFFMIYKGKCCMILWHIFKLLALFFPWLAKNPVMQSVVPALTCYAIKTQPKILIFFLETTTAPNLVRFHSLRLRSYKLSKVYTTMKEQFQSNHNLRTLFFFPILHQLVCLARRYPTNGLCKYIWQFMKMLQISSVGSHRLYGIAFGYAPDVSETMLIDLLCERNCEFKVINGSIILKSLMGRNSGEISDSNGINVLESHVMRSLWKRFQRGKKKKKGLLILCTSTAIWQKWQSRKWRTVIRKFLWCIFFQLVIGFLESPTTYETIEYADTEAKKNIRSRKLYPASKGHEIPPTCLLQLCIC